jgi:hypothetical protein
VIGFHVTTPKKVGRYTSTGAILPPVRFWPDLSTAARWARRTGRTLILEIDDGGESYPLPDHKPARWTPRIVRSWTARQAPSPTLRVPDERGDAEGGA